MRRKSCEVQVGTLKMGAGNPVLVQSMLSCPASDVDANVQQALELQEAGCQIIRVSVPSIRDVRLVSALKEAVDMPVVADIHFDYKIALEAIKVGVDKIRLNPGNIGGNDRVSAVVSACKEKNIPIRIGVNAGSLEKSLLDKYGSPTPEALVESALSHVRLLENQQFFNIVISIKSSHVPTVVQAYRLLATQCNYPLHLGVTEAGIFRTGLVKNAMGIGCLLLDGIGDTLRVSLTDEPKTEIRAGFDILRSAGHYVPGPEIISCPTCGRTNIPVAEIATELEDKLQHSNKDIKVAIMGCVVNGIGEGKEANIGIAGGVDSAVLFVKGKQGRTLRGDYVAELLSEIDKL